jgi:hypothetical protein
LHEAHEVVMVFLHTYGTSDVASYCYSASFRLNTRSSAILHKQTQRSVTPTDDCSAPLSPTGTE